MTLEQWKEDYKARWVKLLITDTLDPMTLEDVEDLVVSSLEAWTDEDEWKFYSPEDAFSEDLTYWTE